MAEAESQRATEQAKGCWGGAADRGQVFLQKEEGGSFTWSATALVLIQAISEPPRSSFIRHVSLQLSARLDSASMR